MSAFANRLPTGPGSRGGRWHEPGYAAAYQRAWRAAHPEYRERERLRRAQERARAKGDPVGITEPPTYPRPLPVPAAACVCACGCPEPVVVLCGFCRDGLHR